jgi:phage terminase large subunit-like protein
MVEKRRRRRVVAESKGDYVINWIEKHCRIPEGKDVGKRVELRDWQKKLIKKIYNNPLGTRRAIISFGRKNAKTTLSAFLLLTHLCSDVSKPNSQLYSAAQSRDQAAILFNLAAKIVRLSSDLRDFVTVRDTSKQLFCPGRGTLYRALSAEVSTSFGLSPAMIIFDELGQWRTITIGYAVFPAFFPYLA